MALIHRELSRGNTRRWAVACIAPLLGIFDTTLLMTRALRSYYGLGCHCGDCAGGISEALVPVVLSLPAAVLACAGFHWLGHQMETFDLEMRTARLDLLNALARRGCERRQ